MPASSPLGTPLVHPQRRESVKEYSSSIGNAKAKVSICRAHSPHQDKLPEIIA
jgi:hypothetical protein